MSPDPLWVGSVASGAVVESVPWVAESVMPNSWAMVWRSAGSWLPSGMTVEWSLTSSGVPRLPLRPLYPAFCQAVVDALR